MQYRKSLHQQYIDKVETQSASNIGHYRPKSMCLLLASMTAEAPCPHSMAAQPCMKDSFTNRPKFQNFVALRTLVDAHGPEDCTCRLTTYSFLVAISARGPGILHDKMHAISGRGDSLVI